MHKKRKASHKLKANLKKSLGTFLFNKWSFQIIVILGCVFLSYCVFLDFHIRKKFDEKRWTVPARVYAQPLELYAGRRYEKGRVIKRLKSNGYKNVRILKGPGQFLVRGSTVEIYTRQFHYWDGIESAKKLKIKFNNNQVTSITEMISSQNISIIRLTPALIGKIFPLHDEDRILVTYEEIPETLIEALIVVEDRHYFEHFGLDPFGILRAIYINGLDGKLTQGGSTLTQQLIKNMFLTRERTFTRKINEMLMALMLEYHYSKEDIFSAYVNEIYLGQNGKRGIHGFATAAEFYFSKPLNELNNAEIALLVGMVKGASYYNPRKQSKRALKRRNLVLNLLKKEGFINKQELKIAISKSLNVSDKPRWSSAKYPAYLDLVRRHLKRDYRIDDLRNEGLIIHTSLDIDKQEISQHSVEKSLSKLEKRKGFISGTLQAALVVVNQHSGEVLALIGDRNKKKNAFNRALDAKRSIGSLIKPAIYMTALNRPAEYNILSSLDDSELVLKQQNGKIWKPNNYDKKTHGDIPLVRSITKSYNLSTVRLGMSLGLENVIQTLKNLGVTSPIPLLPSILLGALNLSPYEVTQMYQTIASGGLQIPLRTIRYVSDSNEEPLKQYDLTVREYIKAETAFLMQYLLTEVVQNGTARRLKQELPSLMPLAGKTGTTNALRDSWFAGFGDRILSVVWVGRDNNSSTKLTGSIGAMQVWIDMMKKIKPEPLLLIEPEEIEWRDYPDMSNPNSSCNQIKSYPFVKKYKANSIDCY
ncbi:MAG: penicillin-binding protein 1B [Legionellales bacterium]|nr:penicillin-binding protein 1B [Legionellales bacterium]